jgi:hypothetical protein
MTFSWDYIIICITSKVQRKRKPREEKRRPREERTVEIGGKKAIIVGGASGMAKSSAELLHQKGAQIAILDLPTSAGEEVASALGGTFHPVDVLDYDAVETAIRVERWSPPDRRTQADGGAESDR